MRSVVIVSGGLDSVTLAYKLASEGDQLTVVAVDYGQRHIKELAYASDCAAALDARFIRVDLRAFGAQLKGSALTDREVAVPFGHYTSLSMRATIVPNRNAMLLSLAFAVAVAQETDRVAYGAHRGDHPVYPDCRPAFVAAFLAMERVALEGVRDVALAAPFIDWTKAEIVRLGDRLGVPFEATWSCYGGERDHCGRCGTCVERKEAFELAGVEDPTRYSSFG